MKFWWLAVGAAVTGCAGTTAVGTAGPGRGDFPGLSRITEADLGRDLTTLASDHFRGREAGTLDELRASAWLAEQARAAGLAPAGEDGTYFQFWSLRRTRLAARSRLVVDGQPVELGREAIMLGASNARVDGEAVYVGRGSAEELAGKNVDGRVVVADMTAPAVAIPKDVSIRPARYAFAALGERGTALVARGARAVLIVGDPTADSGWAFASGFLSRGAYGLDSTGQAPAVGTGAPVIWVHGSVGERVRKARRVEVELVAESFSYPSVNVVAKVPGTDRDLAREHVLFSAHQDHDGVRTPVAGDSIWNGADDNATVSVALLAIGRAFVSRPGRRTALFVWHGAEERGLLGSRWHADHPVVPRESIVAVLNADMLGQNHPDSASLLGAQPPHRNSTALVEMALRANDLVSRFAIDTLWDRPTHPEGWYFRSDHVPYARVGIPAVYFSTLPHPLYHTPKDEASTIDVAKLTRATRWMYATGWLAATAESRPALDPGFKLER